jgi:hypothetical protein
MPIKKYRSIEEMDADRRDFWCAKPDAEWWRRIDRLWRQSEQLNPRRHEPGIFKFRSVEELNAHHEAMLGAHVRALRQSRQGEKP